MSHIPALGRTGRILALALCISLSWFVSHRAVAAPAEPRVTVQSIDGLSWHGNHGTLAMTLGIANSLGVDMDLKALRFDCFLEGIDLAKGHSLGEVTIAANSRAALPVRIDMDGATLLGLTATLNLNHDLAYRIEGVAEVGFTGVPVPFSTSGTVPAPLHK